MEKDSTSTNAAKTKSTRTRTKTKRGYMCLKTAHIFTLATTILLSLIITLLCIGIMVRYEVKNEVSSIENIPYWRDYLPAEQKVWFDEAIAELKVALNKNWLKQSARNAIVFATSGIDTEAMAAARALLAGNGNRTLPQMALSWERFPHLGRLKNSCSSNQQCDPFTVATAIFNGVRPKFRLGGLDPSISFGDCHAASNVSHHVKSILQQSQENGMRTGFVTTGRVTGAGVAALYAHTPNTAWECDAALPLAATEAGCIDTALQLIKNVAGSNANVIMGGGRQTLVAHVPRSTWDAVDEHVCDSRDNRNLIRDWTKINLKLKRKFAVLQNNEDLREFNGTTVDHVMGIFANNHIPLMAGGSGRKHRRMPKVSDLIVKALEVLQRKENERGYLLFVETGVGAEASIEEQTNMLVHLSHVVQEIVDMHSEDDTLILSLFTNGFYVSDAVDGSSQIDAKTNELKLDAIADKQLLDMPTEALIYARGPRSYLLHGVHEETYMSYVLSYALEMGRFNRQRANKEKQ